jgi:hypothetical protein
MSRAYERQRADATTPSRRGTRPIQPRPEDAGPELEQLREALGNAAMSRLLDSRTSDAIEARLGGGRPLSTEGPAAPSAAHVEVTTTEGDVRIHDDATAAELSKRLGAVAFTFGRDIFLAADAPDLDSPAGSRMLGHELTHVRQQQTTGTTRPRRVSSPASPAEREAARSGDHAVPTGGPAMARTVHRQESPEEDELMTMTSETVHREVPEEEEVMTMTAETVHRQESPEEDELMTMTSETVHREVAVDEVEAEVEPAPQAKAEEPAPEPKAEEVPAKSGQQEVPANPAASALFQVAVTDRIRFASDNLQSDKPDVKAAYDAFSQARVALRAVTGTYESSDPQLFAKMLVFGNAMAAVLEMLGPLAGVKRSLPDVAGMVPQFVTEAAEIGGMLN